MTANRLTQEEVEKLTAAKNLIDAGQLGEAKWLINEVLNTAAPTMTGTPADRDDSIPTDEEWYRGEEALWQERHDRKVDFATFYGD